MNFEIKLNREEIIGLIERAKIVNHNIELLDKIGLDGLDIADKFMEEDLLHAIAPQLCNWDPDGFWDLVYSDLSAEEIYERIMKPSLEDLDI